MASNNVELHVMYIAVFVGVLLTLLTIIFFVAARTTTSAAGQFGWLYGLFTTFLVVTVLYWGYFPGLEKGPQMVKQVYLNVLRGVVAQSTNGTSAQTIAQPSGSPTDYVEWMDHDHVQLQKSANPLPVGWYVAVTSDKNQTGERVIGPVRVAEGEVWVYFDPDTKIYPGALTSPAASLPNRP